MIELLITLLILLPFALIWTTWKFWRWSSKFHSYVLGGLALSNLVAMLAASPIALLAGRRLWLGPGASSFAGSSEIVIFSILALGSVFIFLYLFWRKDLDKE